MEDTMGTFLNKWVAATVPLVLFFVAFGHFNPHDILVLLVWAAPITYVYGIAISYLLDWVSKKWKLQGRVLMGFLYSLTGALFVIPLLIIFSPIAEMGAFLGFAGIGAGIALVFYLCSLLFRNQKINGVIAIAGPLFLLLMMQIFVFQWETSKKEDWVEKRTGSSYEVSYEYFHGEQPVLIEAKKGQAIVYEMTWTEPLQGSIGHYSLGPDGKHSFIEERGERKYAILADTNGLYEIIITGKKLKEGGFKVIWEVQSE
jgi:hypothetical protein